MTVGITRVHMEEDAGKSLHDGFADSARSTHLDFNRSGVPLIEIVTEPDLRSAADAAEAFSRVREVLVAIGVNDGNMEEGSLRCDANVSVRPAGESAFGVKTELKNLNSFRHVQRAIEFEIERHVQARRDGTPLVQETRLYDPATNRTTVMRTKEDSDDYRYFPEPDLPPLVARRRVDRRGAPIAAGAAGSAAPSLRRAVPPARVRRRRADAVDGARRLLRARSRPAPATRRPPATG